MVAVPVDGAGLLSALDTLPRAFTYPQRLEVHLASVLLSGLLLFVLRPLPPGLSRALVAIPVTLLNFLLPFLFDGDKEMMTNVSIFIVTSSLSSFKALGWALNRGPLVRPLNLAQFLFVYSCPITPREELGAVSGERQAAANGNKKDDDAQHTTAAAAGGGPPRHGGRLREKGLTPAQSLVAFALKGAALAAVCYVLSTFDLPRLARSELYIVSLYCGLSMGMDAPAALAGSLLGLDISPHFDNPFAATSFAELWNKRWNLTVGNALRFLIYDPINELRLVKNPKQSAKFSPLRRLVGVLAVFAMSGFMHEVLYWYFQREWLGGVWQLYFTLWGVLVIVEGILKKILKSAGITIPPWLGWLYTNAVSTIMIDRLWWGPLMARGITEKSVAHAITGVRDAAAYFGLEHWLAGLKVAGLKLA